MFLMWRIAYVRAALQQTPWRVAVRGLASWIKTVGIVAVIVGLAVVVGSDSFSAELVITFSVALMIGVPCVACGLWMWRISQLVDTEIKARYGVLPEVESARLLLRRPTRHDAAALAATTDAEMLTANGWTRRQTRAMVKSVERGRPEPGLLVLEARSDGALIGAATVHPSDNDASSLTLGWWIGPRHRHAGYASEAVAALVDAVHDVGFATIEIGTNESNLAVQRICARIGATEKDRRAQTLPNGSIIPAIWYEHRQATADTP
ncbi:GNAT family N-acetyltransferase [Nocardia sp. SSK8]|uniref:GNAT family N-acetyltransferase n=1 Tax=Nocardia sp. SSK8 TaxID=3120154 RepID=UPI0030096543